MAGPTDAQLGAIRMLIETAPDAALRNLHRAMLNGGGAMALIRDMIVEERQERDLRDSVLAPLLPFCAPAGHESFTARDLTGLWRTLKAGRPGAVELAREEYIDWRPDEPAPAVFDELCRDGAALVRDGRVPGGEAFALCLDFAPLVRETVRRVPEWLGRATDERVAQFRIALRDAETLRADGAPRFFRMIQAHLPEPQLVLRLIAIATDRAGDRYLAASELAEFGETLLADAEVRIERIKAFDADLGPAAAVRLGEDVTVACAVLAELEQSVDLSRDGPWGKRVAVARQKLATNVESRLREIEGAVGKALPWRQVKLSGRITRPAPCIEQAVDEDAVTRARALLGVIEATRTGAPVGGYGALRGQVAEKVAERLETYADEAMHMIHTGEATDVELAVAWLAVAAEFLDLAEAGKAAALVRRRAAAAGAPQVSPAVA